MRTQRSHTSNSPPPLPLSINNDKTLMNRKQLQQVIINKFIKDFPQIQEQTIENTVSEYLGQLNGKLQQLNLKELKNIISDLATRQQTNPKKSSTGFQLEKINSATLLNSIKDQNSTNKTNIEQIDQSSLNKQNQVKKVNYPQISKTLRIGQSLSPRGSSALSEQSTSSSQFQSLSSQNNQIFNKSHSNQNNLQKYERGNSPPARLENNQLLDNSCNETQSLNQQYNKKSTAVKSILKKNDRSLSPLNDRQQNLYDQTIKINQDHEQKIKTEINIENYNNKGFQSQTLQRNEELSTTDEHSKRGSQNALNQIHSKSEQQSNISNKCNQIKQKQLDDTIKKLQKNNYNIIHGQGQNQQNSYWSHLDDIHKYSNKNNDQDQLSEWKRKFDDIKNIRLEKQIVEEQKKQEKQFKRDNLDYPDSDSDDGLDFTISQYNKNKLIYPNTDVLSQQQYIDINYAEEVKRNIIQFQKDEKQQKINKLQQQNELKQFYDSQLNSKKNKNHEENQADKQFIVMDQIIQEQQKRQQKNLEINLLEKQTRSNEIYQKEKYKIIEKEKAMKNNKHLRSQFEQDYENEKEIQKKKKQEEHEFYLKAIQDHKINNTKEQQEQQEKQLDKIYMENYTNLLDQQEQQRLNYNLQRQKEIQEFVKKQAENHPRLREKKLKQEERVQMKQKVQELAYSENQEKSHANYQKRKLQEQMRNFLNQQIEEKKEIQEKNYIDYDKIQMEACEQYHKEQTEYDNKIQLLRKQQENDNFLFLNDQIKQNIAKNTKYFYPIAFNQILNITDDNNSQQSK